MSAAYIELSLQGGWVVSVGVHKLRYMLPSAASCMTRLHPRTHPPSHPPPLCSYGEFRVPHQRDHISAWQPPPTLTRPPSRSNPHPSLQPRRVRLARPSAVHPPRNNVQNLLSSGCSYGEFVVLDQHDHISVCKPSDPSDPAYARLMAFLHARVKTLRKERADAAAGSMDHMEAASL